MKLGRLAVTVISIIAICALGVAIKLATDTNVVAVVNFGENTSLPTPTPAPEYRIYYNESTGKIHAEYCHYAENSQSVTEISKQKYFELIPEGAQICSFCEEDLAYLNEITQ